MARGRKKTALKVVSSNGFDPDVLRELVGRLDEIDAAKLSEKGKFMKRMRELNDDVKDVFKEAKARGIPTKPLRAELKVRDLLRKASDTREALEAEDAEQATLIAEALGDYADLPLGQAAVSAAQKRDHSEELADSIRSDDDDDWGDAAGTEVEE